MNVLYVKTSNSSFIKIDQEILENNFNTSVFFLDNKKLSAYILNLFKLLVYLSKNRKSIDLVFIRFADYHTALLRILTRLFHQKLIIVVGGYDAHMLKEYKYGVYCQSIRSLFAKYSLRNADFLLPVSSILIENINNFAFDYPLPGGIKHFVPDSKAKLVAVNNGYKVGFWNSDYNIEKKNTAICIAKVNDYRTFKIKGIDLFINCARNLKDYSFVLVGTHMDFLLSLELEIPANLKVYPFAPQEEIKRLYHESKVYCSFSLTEGMPNVVSEAMLCRCVPIGSRVGGTAEIIGDCGFVAESKDIGHLSDLIIKAMQSNNSLGEQARQRIIDNFSFERREKAIRNLINEIDD